MASLIRAALGSLTAVLGLAYWVVPAQQTGGWFALVAALWVGSHGRVPPPEVPTSVETTGE